MFDVVLSDAAKADLRKNTRWWAENRSREQAERWYVEIIEKIYSLEFMPTRCPPAPEAATLNLDIRNLLFGLSRLTHRVLFEIDGQTVNVFRVLHMSQTTIETADELG